jgi:dCTP diphosphatase
MPQDQFMHTFDYVKMEMLIKNFVEERKWDQFHSPKNLSMALNVEASELLEIFQWMPEVDSNNVSNDPIKMKAIQEELADIAYYLILMSSKLNINLEKAMLEKMKLNELKYPANTSQGSSKKYDEF